MITIKSNLLFLAIPMLMLVDGCKEKSNFPKELGLPIKDSEIILQMNPTNAIYDEHFVKFNLDMTRAKSLRALFVSKKSSKAFINPVLPIDIPLVKGVPSWNPRKLKKFYAGSFDAKRGSDTYHCKYVFDMGVPNHISIYLYAIYSAQ